VLGRLDSWNDRRRALADAYRRTALAEVARLPESAPGTEPVFHMYVVRSAEREALSEALGSDGIETRVQYATPVHRQRGMAPWRPPFELEVTDEAARTNLALPMGPTLGDNVADRVGAAAARFAEERLIKP